MAVRLREVPPAVALEPLDDAVVGLLVGDQTALDVSPVGSGERAVGADRAGERESVLEPGLVVVGAEGGSHVHQAGSVIRGHEPTRHDHPRGPVVRQGHDIERTAVAEPDQLPTRERPPRPDVREARRTLLGAARQPCP